MDRNLDKHDTDLKAVKSQKLRIVWLAFALILIGILTQSWYYAPIFYPQRYFAHRTNHANLELHSNFAPALAAGELAWVHGIISAHPFFDETATYRIFLCETIDEYARFVSLMGLPENSQGQNIQPLGHVFISVESIARTRQGYGEAFESALLEGSVTHIMLHELTHTLVNQHIGYWQSRSLPFWISEGYAEYVAGQAQIKTDSGDLLTSRLRHFMQVKQDIPRIRRAYLLSGLLVEYLLDIERLDVEQLLSTPMLRQEALKRLNSWHNRRASDDVSAEKET